MLHQEVVPYLDRPEKLFPISAKYFQKSKVKRAPASTLADL